MAIAKDRAILVSSHAVTDLEPLATRIVVLRDGVLVDVVTDGDDRRVDEIVVALLGSS